MRVAVTRGDRRAPDAAVGAPGAAPRDAPARQRTLRATIDWSYELFSAEERDCFARLAVFSGGATLEAAEAITGAGMDTLDRLVAKSLLVRRDVGGRTRLAMLETVRAYAVERFGALRQRDAVRERHYDFYLALARRHGTDPALTGTSRKEHFVPARCRDRELRGGTRVGGRTGRHRPVA